MKLVKNLKRLKEELENRLQQLYDCYGDLLTTGLDADIRLPPSGFISTVGSAMRRRYWMKNRLERFYEIKISYR